MPCEVNSGKSQNAGDTRQKCFWNELRTKMQGAGVFMSKPINYSCILPW